MLFDSLLDFLKATWLVLYGSAARSYQATCDALLDVVMGVDLFLPTATASHSQAPFVLRFEAVFLSRFAGGRMAAGFFWIVFITSHGHFIEDGFFRSCRPVRQAFSAPCSVLAGNLFLAPWIPSCSVPCAPASWFVLHQQC